MAVTEALQQPVTEARLFYSTVRGNYVEFPIRLTAETRDSAEAVLHQINNALRNGEFPAAPRKDGCALLRLRSGLRPLRRGTHRAQKAGPPAQACRTAGAAVMQPAPITARGCFVEASAGTGKTHTPRHRDRGGDRKRRAGRPDRRRYFHPRRRRDDEGARPPGIGAPEEPGTGPTVARPRIHRHHPLLLCAPAPSATRRGACRSGLPRAR